MATRVNGTAESLKIGSYTYKITPYFYYTLTETNTDYKLALYGGINFNSSYSDLIDLSLQITGTGKTTQSKVWEREMPAGDTQFINSFSWNWTKTKATQTITIKAIHGGWTDTEPPKPAGKPAYAASKTFTIPAKPSYAIKYDGNGGSGAPAGQTKWYGEDINLQAGKPTRTGYVFKNWNTKKDGTGTNYNPSQKYSTNSALTLYAIWEPLNKITVYDQNGNAHTGRLYVYDANGNRRQCIISVYDANGNRKYPKG